MAAVVISICMLLGALISGWPYAYFVWLRWVVAATCVYCAVRGCLRGDLLWVCVLGGIAALFNPLYPVHLPRGTWRVVDVVVAVTMAAWALRDSRNGPRPPSEIQEVPHD